MRFLSRSMAGLAVWSAFAGLVSAQGVVSAAHEPIYHLQEPTQPSPSDIRLPEVPPPPAAAETWGETYYSTDGLSDEPDAWELFPTNRWGLKIGGWTQIGYHSENSIADGFNQYADHLALHQQWLYAEKVADGSCGWDWGFRFDALYGIDADNTQSFGNPGGRWDNAASFDHGPYGWAMPQAYVEVASGDLSVIAGHFYTLIGYEVVPAPDNFFYSHSFTMNNSEPFTHTGVLATYQASERLTVYGGWTLGWDTGFDQFGGGSNFLGGFSYALSDAASLTYINTIGDFGSYFGFRAEEAYSHSVVLDLDLTERLKYVFQTDLLHIGRLGGAIDNHQSYGINQYLIYTLNDCWSFGARVEWWHADVWLNSPNLPPAFTSASINEVTFGVNYRPHTNFVIRPEIRHEWSPAAAIDYDQTIFGIDAILTY